MPLMLCALTWAASCHGTVLQISTCARAMVLNTISLARSSVALHRYRLLLLTWMTRTVLLFCLHGRRRTSVRISLLGGSRRWLGTAVQCIVAERAGADARSHSV